MTYSKDNIAGVRFKYNGTSYQIFEVIDDEWLWMSAELPGYSRYKGKVSVIVEGLNSGKYYNINKEPQIKDNYELY